MSMLKRTFTLATLGVLLTLALTISLRATSNDFTAVGAGTELAVRPGDLITYSTDFDTVAAVGSVVLQQFINGGWSRRTAVITATTSGTMIAESCGSGPFGNVPGCTGSSAPIRLRWFALAYTSGTMTAVVTGSATASSTSTATAGQVLYDCPGNVCGFGSWDGTRFATTSTGGLTLLSGGAAGAYTLARSGVVMRDSLGSEIWRLWGTDPDDTNDYNSKNIYLGFQAGLGQPTNNVDAGYLNIGIGSNTLATVTTGYRNVAVGHEALASVLGGWGNVILGWNSGNKLTTGYGNALVGDQAGYHVTTGRNNAAIGSALFATTTGFNNAAVGYNALNDNVDGSYNVGVGYASGQSATGSISDTEMVFLGHLASSQNAAALTNGIALGASTLVTASNRAVIGNSSVADVYLGSESAAALLHSAGMLLTNGSAVKSDTTTAHTYTFDVYDNNTGPASVAWLTATNGNTPSVAIAPPAGGTTISGAFTTLSQGGNAISLAGALTTAGANALTFTTTAPTTVTLPTSGTLLAAGAAISGTSITGTSLVTSGTTGVSVANVGADSCGTTAATIAGNDNIGEVTVGATSGTQCRVTFAVAATTRRECVVTDTTTTIATRAVYVDTTHSDLLGAFVAGDAVAYVCFAR